LQKVFEFVSTVHDLCAVLGMDFFSTVTEVHPSLNDSTGVQSKSISNETLARLANTVLTLKEDKKQRLHKVVNYMLSIVCNFYILLFLSHKISMPITLGSKFTFIILNSFLIDF
jgi:hypothetical protein